MQKRSAKKATGSGVAKKAMSSGASVPKKARTMGEAASKTNTEQQDEEEKTNVFSHEMDTLECDICCMPFESQVYTCKNGHAACGQCCISMKRKCSCCNEPIGDFRCRATERILAGMTRPCKFRKHGCPETVWFTEMRLHEEACRYAPYCCPFDGCPYSGLQLYGHILDDHAAAGVTSHIGLRRRTMVRLQKGVPFSALLHRDGESVFLLLNGGDVLTGRSLSVVCIGPQPTGDDVEDDVEGVGYTMEVKGHEPGSLTLRASGTVQFVRRLEGIKAKGFLFVPDAVWGSSGSVTVTVTVQV